MNEALQIVDAAADRTSDEAGAGADVVEAMRTLRDSGVERSTLVWFWQALHGDNEIGRSQNANAARNRIRHLLRSRLSPIKRRSSPLAP